MINIVQRGLWVAAALLSCALAVRADDYGLLQAKAVAYAKRIPAVQLDPGLPKITFSTWLVRTFPKAHIVWELNDCGEGGDRDPIGVPYCVEAQVRQPDGLLVSVAVAIGDYPHLIHGKPAVFWVTITSGGSQKQVPKLADLPAALR